MEGLDWSSQPFQYWVYVWSRPVWPLATRKEKLFSFPNLGCAHNWFFFFSIAETKIQRGKKACLDTTEYRSFFPCQNESPTLRRAVSSRVFCFSWNVSTRSTCVESWGSAGLSSSNTTVGGESVILLCRRFLTWGMSSAWNKLLPFPLLV